MVLLVAELAAVTGELEELVNFNLLAVLAAVVLEDLTVQVEKAGTIPVDLHHPVGKQGEPRWATEVAAAARAA